MTTYITITDPATDPGAPITSDLLKQLRDNPIALSEGDNNAPVNQSAWHPYDKVTNSDSNKGLIYSFASNGAVGAVETPTFLSGFEYRLRYDLGWSVTTNMLFQGWDGSTWVTIFDTTQTDTLHQGFFELGYNLRVMGNDVSGQTYSNLKVSHIATTGSAFPYTKMRVSRPTSPQVTVAGSFVWLDKRRAYNG